MFIELTEIIKDSLQTYASDHARRPISINTDKIQAFFSERSTCNTIIQLRQENIKVEENYETVKTMLS